MIVDNVDQRTVRSALALANHAPSMHNSQPWRWLLGPHSAHLFADLRRWLPASDADGRDLVVSLGAALHHARVALAASGLASVVHRLPNPDQPDHLAAFELHNRHPADADLGLAAAIVQRRTDRRRYSNWPLPLGFVEELAAHAAEQGAVLRAVDEPAARKLVIEAIADAARAQETVPGCRTETALWTRRHADDGVPAENLLRDAVGTGAGTARDFGEGLIEQLPSGPDGATLFVLGTASDDTLSQLRAGEALSAVTLHATVLGLATCPLSQPLEVGTTRAALADRVLGGSLSPQIVLRVGWAPHGPALPATPRRAVADVIERMPR
jgi:nitroreductase